jgi:hypothetical protein
MYCTVPAPTAGSCWIVASGVEAAGAVAGSNTARLPLAYVAYAPAALLNPRW